MIRKEKKPTTRELSILQILWKLGPSTVREVHEALNAQADHKTVGYTTTLKFMQVMHEKGLLSRKMEGISHIYTPTVSEEETVKETLDKIVETTFQGSTTKLVLQLLGDHKTTQNELQMIRDFLDDLEKESGNDKNQRL